MAHNIHPKPDHIQPQIHEGESARYQDVGYWNKEVAFIHPQTDQPASKNIDFANLTALVEAEARSRFPKFDKLSKKEKKEICEQIAHSAINRPDIKETAWLEAKLLKDLGISSKIENELCKLLPEGAVFGVSSAKELRDFFLENYHLPPEELQKHLELKLTELNWKYQSPIRLLLDFQEKLIKIFTTEQIYLRNNKEFTNKTFLDDFGHPITLTLPIASSMDRNNLHLQNARVVKSGGEFLAATGRPDTYVKAIEQAQMLIRNGQAQDGHLNYVVNSYVNVSFEENSKMLQNEIDTLNRIDGQQITVDGKLYTLHPILFNTQLTMKPFEPFAPIDISGKQASEQLNRANFVKFKTLVDSLKTAQNTSFIDKIMAKLDPSNSLQPEEEILLRAVVCHYLGIPSIHHCASSKDRTTVGLAIAGALRKWIALHELLGKNPFPGNDPLLLWKNEAFKHLVAQELPGCHQLSRNGLGTRGTIYGKELHDDRLGFKLRNDILSRILPMHYLKEASLPKKALMFFAAAGAWILCTLIALTRIFILPVAIYNPEAALEGFLNIFRIHRFASLIPSKELNPKSPYVKDRHLIEKKGATEPHFLLKLEKTPDLDTLIQEMGKKNPTITTKEHREALILIANNWERLSELKTSKKLKKLIALCDNSHLTLFRLRKLYTAQFASQVKNLYTLESIPDSLQREADKGSIEKNGIYTQIELDVSDQRSANTFIEVTHKDKRIQIMRQEAPKIIEQLAPFPFAENGEIPLPIQALLTQTGKSISDAYLEAFFALSAKDIMLQQRPFSSQSFWDVSLHVIDDSTVMAKYRAPFEIKDTNDYNNPPLDVLSLEFSVTLKKQTNGNWEQSSSNLDKIRHKFIDHDELFKSDAITKTQTQITQEFRKTRACNRTRRLAKNLLEVLDKNQSFYKPKLLHELRYLYSIDSGEFRDFVREQKIDVKTTLLGRITDVKKSAERIQNEREKVALDAAETVLRAWKQNPDLEFDMIQELEALKLVLPPVKFIKFCNSSRILIEEWNGKIIFVNIEGQYKHDQNQKFLQEKQMEWPLFSLRNLQQVMLTASLKNTSNQAHSKANQTFENQKKDLENKVFLLLNQMEKQLHPIKFYRMLARNKIEIVRNSNNLIESFVVHMV